MATFKIQDIAAALGAKLVGDADLVVSGLAEPQSADAGTLAVAMDEHYQARLKEGQAQVALLADGADWQGLGLRAAILVARPRVAMAHATAMMDAGLQIATGTDPSAIIGDGTKIGVGASIAPLVVIGANCSLGDDLTVGAHVSIGANVTIGRNAVIHSGVRIGSGTRIGDNFVAQPGAVIGGDGFSFVTAEISGVENVRDTLGDQGETDAQPWLRIHSLGGVAIGDDVEIGANSTVDQGTVRATQIGDGTKIDSQVQVGHNVQVGRHCLLCAQVGVAGSTIIGDHVVLGGQTGVGDNLTIGDRVISAGGTIVLSNVAPGQVLMGYPAVKMDAHIENYKALRRLPRFMKEMRRLQKSVSKSDHRD